MKIAMIGQKGIPAIYGGIERHVEELARELVNRNHEVLVYARKWYTPTKITEFKGIKIIHTASIRTKHLDTISGTLTATLSAIKQKPAVIHYHGVGPSLLAWIPKILAPKIKVVVTTHCLDRYHQKWSWFARLILRLGEKTAAYFADHTITVSKTLHGYYLNEYQTNTIYIPNGIRKIDQFPTGDSILRQFNLEPKKYIVMISRLVRHKGAHYLLEAWQFVKKQYPQLLKEYKLVIVGDSANTDNYVKELKAMVRGDNSIVFAGWQKDAALEQLYFQSLFLTHPSENEGLPITVLQAMSFGCPVLVSDIPEHKEIVLDSKYWFANANTASLADKLVEMLKNKSN